MKENDFGSTLVAWYNENGRHDLPWQTNSTPYRVWLSEIMLQQTQVATVIPYYLQFLQSFPSIDALATASEDEVLAHWSGLGYYARARNLYRAAKIIQSTYDGIFPTNLEAIIELPGIGRSTAGAILSFSKKQFAVILDGNVKRVLTRIFAINDPVNKAKTVNSLWELAASLTPKNEAHLYNQAIMDLGATLCTRSKPNCVSCPFVNSCLAYKQGTPTKYPVKTPKKNRSVRQIRLLIILNGKNEMLLIKRPNKGIWGGLWCFPECDLSTDHKNWRSLNLIEIEHLPSIKHQLTHMTLEITPTLLSLQQTTVIDYYQSTWYPPTSELPGGIPIPVTKILHQLRGLK